MKIILITMIVMGIVGGLINYLLTVKTLKLEKFEIIKSLTFGIGASFLVPLFLNTISSTLINESKSDNSKLLVFSGFCLIASIFSKNFIFSISKKVLKDLEDKQDNLSKNIDNVEDKVKEIVKTFVDSNETYILNEENLEKLCLTTDEKQVIKSIVESKFNFRSINGLSKELNKSKDSIEHIIEELSNKNLVVEAFISDSGREKLYGLSRSAKYDLLTRNSLM